jgi:hypothetical protein
VIYCISTVVWLGVCFLFLASTRLFEQQRTSGMGFAIDLNLAPLFTAILATLALTTLVFAPITTLIMVCSLSHHFGDVPPKQKEKRKHIAHDL